MRKVAIRLPNEREILLEAPEHLFVPRILQEKGMARYEPDSLAASLAVLSLRDGLFVDVGANIGVFSILTSAVLNRQCMAFEPLPDAAAVLEDVARRYDLPVTVSRVALSNHSGQEEFFVSAQTDSSSGLNRRFRPVKESFTVDVAPLDDLLREQEIALVKIDTETTEPQVLEGCQRIIDSNRPYLIVEVLKGRTEDQLQAFLDAQEYVAYHIDDRETWAASESIQGDPNYNFNNWLFSPVPLDSSFWAELTHWRRELQSA
jgi:FkbM family methyltransferase